VTDARLLTSLITAPKLKELAVLRLTATSSTWQKKKWARFAEGLAGRCRAATLRVLDLTGNPLTAADAEALVKTRAVGGLVALDLSATAIGSGGAAALAAAPWERLRTLKLTNCGIDAEGAIALAGSPALAGLESLTLQDNRLCAEGVVALAR